MSALNIWGTLVLVIYLELVCGYVSPIAIHGKQFIDSITGEPFFIKGVDYQPGGSSEVTEDNDPLSDSAICARDIVLFQDLGINTIRIYSLNPDLNHDKCMSMLAVAGIYVILDVNSPLQNQHLNRYEPWTTYNPVYLEHIFKLVEQFSYYNNTLGFFAGNEVINDKISAQISPPYVKNVIGDMKTYIKTHSPRVVPVGYSAADDLNYRIPLSSYLECAEEQSASLSVDFYGVNSYQWCGRQTMQTSGYDQLVDAYKNYTKPVFFSEFGCNKVLPRTFDEVQALFSENMFTTFSGGLVYEFSQEDNGYGLVEINSNGTVKVLDDFDSLKKHYKTIRLPNSDQISSAIAEDRKISQQAYRDETPSCQATYENLNTNAKVTKGLASSLVKAGVEVEKGQYVDLTQNDLRCTLEIVDNKGITWQGDTEVKTVRDLKPYLANPKHLKNDKQRKNVGSTAKISLWPSLFFILLTSMIQMV
ncbi:glycolipid anchored surface protein 4 precursor [Zygosaccharomyces mellis]|uniref:1,3-beta-glucanosyltransferase n=1 Tax=Zygosaccharomyces mellis TaxID=42258 RepID=A0A4C2E9E2_9SACH|nr:glycolipid anchored surface protein 4 precursor [Zygosaccharomyces mellis]